MAKTGHDEEQPPRQGAAGTARPPADDDGEVGPWTMTMAEARYLLGGDLSSTFGSAVGNGRFGW